ncbi:MAG: hypothetical protein U9M92_01115 [Patescibacteria group bacterium]|nr:hypothetical protein [Patescibacteria group bacterium]
MHNKGFKNWNNFFLGLVIVLLPWLSLPKNLKAGLISFLGLLIALFSLARLRRLRSAPRDEGGQSESDNDSQTDVDRQEVEQLAELNPSDTHAAVDGKRV